MKNKGLFFFALGIVIGLVSNLASRKALDVIKFFPEGWHETDDMQHWA